MTASLTAQVPQPSWFHAPCGTPIKVDISKLNPDALAEAVHNHCEICEQALPLSKHLPASLPIPTLEGS